MHSGEDSLSCSFLNELIHEYFTDSLIPILSGARFVAQPSEGDGEPNPVTVMLDEILTTISSWSEPQVRTNIVHFKLMLPFDIHLVSYLDSTLHTNPLAL